MASGTPELREMVDSPPEPRMAEQRARPDLTDRRENASTVEQQTKAEVKVHILDEVYAKLPTPPFKPEEKQAVAAEDCTHVWHQAVRGELAMAA